MGGERILAKWPPIASWFAFLMYAGIATGTGAIVRWFVGKRDELFAAKEGGMVWSRLGFVIAVGVVALLATAACVRIIQRWVFPARVSIDGDHLIVRLPRRRRWWMLLQPRASTTRIPTAEVRSLRLLPLSPAVLEIEAGERTIQVPSKLFAIGVYSLDAGLREVIGSGAWPHPMAKVNELACWRASYALRVFMPIAGIAMMFGGAALMGLLREGGGKIGFLPFILGLGLVLAVAFYRGAITLDARGMFYERGGTTSYIAWSELDLNSIEVKSNLLGALKELRVSSAKASTVQQRISLNRILGLGFPLDDIASELERLACKYR